jgi:hypothetical protein
MGAQTVTAFPYTYRLQAVVTAGSGVKSVTTKLVGQANQDKVRTFNATTQGEPRFLNSRTIIENFVIPAAGSYQIEIVAKDRFDREFKYVDTVSNPNSPTANLDLVLTSLTTPQVVDTDRDGLADNIDKCPNLANFVDFVDANGDGQVDSQLDNDNDGMANLCDTDDDNDTILDTVDNCTFIANSDQANRDRDTFGDACDSDADAREFNPKPVITVKSPLTKTVNRIDGSEKYKLQFEITSLDNLAAYEVRVGTDRLSVNCAQNIAFDGNGSGCVVRNFAPVVAANKAPFELDIPVRNQVVRGKILAKDDEGDVTEKEFTVNVALAANTTPTDTDRDGVADTADNCPSIVNADQKNTDAAADGGDACDSDDDNDGVLDGADNCSLKANSDQADTDRDGVGNVCDETPNGPTTPTPPTATFSGEVVYSQNNDPLMPEIKITGLPVDGVVLNLFEQGVTGPKYTAYYYCYKNSTITGCPRYEDNRYENNSRVVDLREYAAISLVSERTYYYKLYVYKNGAETYVDTSDNFLYRVNRPNPVNPTPTPGARLPQKSCEYYFADVSPASPSCYAIALARELGVFYGYKNNYGQTVFNPRGDISRAEILAVTNRFAGLPEVNYFPDADGNLGFRDLTLHINKADSNWFMKEVKRAKAFLKGYPDGTFRPFGNTTYAEAVKLILESGFRGGALNGAKPTFVETGTPWFAGYFQFSADKGVFIRQDGNSVITREAVAQYFADLYNAGLIRR